MNKALILSPLLLLLVFARADASQPVLDTLERATTAYEQALALEHGWSVTEPLMEEARQALAEGDDTRALELAERALLTAEMSLKQARKESTNWKDRVRAN